MLQALAASALLIVLASTSAAYGAYPGENGRIAFSAIVDFNTGDTTIYTIRPDGTGRQHLTGPMTDAASWAPDGRWIAYHDYSGPHGVRLWVIGADGTHNHQVSFHAGDQGYPTWSPDGTRLAFDGNWPDDSPVGIHAGVGILNLKTGHVREITRLDAPCTDCVFADGNPTWSPDGKLIAFERLRNNLKGQSALFTVRPDGSHLHQLTSFKLDPGPPDWAPDSSRLVFDTNDEKTNGDGITTSDIATVPRNGGPITYLTHNDPTIRASFMASYSPDGKHIVFVPYRFGASHPTLKIMGADGKGRRLVHTGFAVALLPDWGVVPTN